MCNSCGCYSKEVHSTHGLHDHALFDTWYHMNERCYNIKCKAYCDWGFRGITVCDSWRSEKFGGLPDFQGLKNFLEWTRFKAQEQFISWHDLQHKKYGKKRFWTIHRIDNDGPYSIKNCCWATTEEQLKGKRKIITNYEYDILNKKYKELLLENKDLKEKIYV